MAAISRGHCRVVSHSARTRFAFRERGESLRVWNRGRLRVSNRLVTAGYRAQADRDPVPGIDLGHRQGEIDDFLLGELLSRDLVHFVRRVGLAYERQSFGPLQRRPLAVGVERRLAPGIESIETLLGFA